MLRSEGDNEKERDKVKHLDIQISIRPVMAQTSHENIEC